MRFRAFVLLMCLCAVIPPALLAQTALRVLEWRPGPEASPGDVITITFDRPVSGMVEQAVDPAATLRFRPAIDARIEWRDPSTIRIVPRSPLRPGGIYVITVDTTFRAIDGGRLPSPVSLEMRLSGPKLVASDPGLAVGAAYVAPLPPNGEMRLVYSSEVDSAALARTLRVQLTGCAGRTIPFRVVRQRPLADNDPWSLRYGFGSSDSIVNAFRRLVEVTPQEPLPGNCDGELVLPSLDPADASEIRYHVRTAPPFRVTESGCQPTLDCLANPRVSIVFTAPVRGEDLRSRVTFEPPQAFTADFASELIQWWSVAGRFDPRRTYRIRFDSSLRDVYGRRLTSSSVLAITTGDHRPGIGYATGLVTLPAAGRPALRVRHVNVDSAEILLVPVPDSSRVPAVLDPYRGRDTFGWGGRDSVRRVVGLAGIFNEVRVSDLFLPELTERFRNRLVAVEIRIRKPKRAAEDTGRSPVLILADYPRTRAPITLVQRSEVLAHAKVGPWGSAIFVTHARTGVPQANATVRLYDSRGTLLAWGRTNADGLSRLVLNDLPPSPDTPHDDVWFQYPWSPRRAHVAEVSARDDRTLVTVRPGEGALAQVAENSAGSYSWGPSATPARAAVFTDRGIYRPGEPIYAAAVVRDGPMSRLREPRPGDSLRWRSAAFSPRDGEWRTVRDTVLPLSAFGTSVDSFRVSPGAALGEYQLAVAVRRNGRWAPLATVAYTVAEYRAPEFTVQLRADSGVRFLGDTARARLSARFLFDAPMAGAEVRWSAASTDLQPWELHIPGLPRGFSVGDAGAWWEPSQRRGWSTSGVDTLDAAGMLELRAPTDSLIAARGARISFDVAVQDVNRQNVTATATQHMHAASFYLAMRASGSGYWWRTGTPRRVEVLAVRPDGRRVPGVRVRATLISYRWSPQLVNGRPNGGWTWRADTVQIDSLSTADTARALRLTTTREGYHTIVLTAADEAGRNVRSSIAAYAMGNRGITDNSPVRLNVVLAQERYRTGDTAAVAFVSPFDSADAWVTVEREDVLWQRRLAVRRGVTTVPVVVGEPFVPNALVSVMLVARRSAQEADSLHRRLRLGYARFDVDRTPKRLTVKVRPVGDVYAPGDSAVMMISVKDAADRPASAAVAVWAADEGVLSLTGFQRPDPVELIFQSTYLQVTTGSSLLSLRSGDPSVFLRRMVGYDQYGYPLAVQLSAAVVTTATGTASPELMVRGVNSIGSPALQAQVRQDFRTTAFYRAFVNTDASGMARVAVKLPDNITTFRLIAVAAARGDRFGSGESPLIVTKPLLARAALPRFVRPGDEMRAGAVVNARDGRSRNVEVTASAEGIELTGDTRQRLTLAESGSEARFAWRVREGDSAHVRLAVTDGTLADAVEVRLPVRPAYTPRAHAYSAIVRDSATIRFPLPAGIDPARSRLTIRIGTSPLPTIHVAGQYLMSYRYYCSEQLAAAGRYLVSVIRLQRARMASRQDSSIALTNLQSVVHQLARRQRMDGGFGYWSPESWTTSWLTAHVGLLLLDARDVGSMVDSTTLTGASAYLRSVLAEAPAMTDTSFGTRTERHRTAATYLSDRLAAADFLVRSRDSAGYAEASRLRDFATYLTWEDRVRLAHVFARAGQTADARSLLAQSWSATGMVGARVDIPDSLLGGGMFASRIRPVARLLSATLAIEPDHPRLGALVERIVQRTRAESSRWWNTQDHGSAAVALAEFATRHRGGIARLVVSAVPQVGAGILADLTSRDGAARDTTIALTDLLEADGDSAALLLRLRTSGVPVFYALTVEEVPLQRPVTPDVRGVSVERWYERFDNGRAVTEVREGDLVRVRLRLTVPADREFIALEDLLPAGLEAVDLSLRTSGTLGPFRTRESDSARAEREREARGPALYGSWDSGWWTPWEHSEKRDDRVVFFARMLWRGSYTASYVARATTAGRFVRPPAHAEEMYNPAANGRSEGGWFRIIEKAKQ